MMVQHGKLLYDHNFKIQDQHEIKTKLWFVFEQL